MPPMTLARCATARAAAALTLAVLAACGGGESKSGSAPTQTAAQVNKDEISVHQVNLILRRTPQLAADQPEAAARRVLDGLIEQELAAQGARAAGLDGDPRYVQAQQIAKREWLARAYQDQLVERVTGPTGDEVERYYEAHPALFAQRRVYVLQEAIVPGDAARVERVRQIAAAAKTPSDLLDALRAASLTLQSRMLAQSPEDLPMAVVESLAKLQVGQSMVFAVPGAARIVSVVQAQPAPVDLRTARPVVESLIVADRKRQLVAEGMKALRDKAQIVYSGPFAASAPAASAVAAQ